MKNIDEQKFYELMQTYRHTPISDIKKVSLAFEEIKNFIREEIENDSKNFALWIGSNLKQNRNKSIDELYKEFKKFYV